MAQKVIEHVEAHYDTREVPFGKTYEWHPGYIILECGCGEKRTLSSTSARRCRCGADHGVLIRDLLEKEDRLREKVTHPWHHDTREQVQQHLRDEATYPGDSPWRYDDITADPWPGLESPRKRSDQRTEET